MTSGFPRKPLHEWWVVKDTGYETPCWLWIGAMHPKGHGIYCYEGKKTTQAYRYVYEVYKGKIPEGYQLHHLCYICACVNPDHLQLMTDKEHKNTNHIRLRNRWKR